MGSVILSTNLKALRTSCHVQLQLEGVVCKSEGGLSPLFLRFGSAVDIPDSKNVKNKCLVFISHPDYGIFL